jgi:L-fucose isomerase-like protein
MVPRANPPQRASRRFAVFTAISTIHDPSAMQDLVASYLSPLRELGGAPWSPGEGARGVPLVVFVATGGTEREILRLAQVDPGEPVLLLAHPGHNSLPAALEVLAHLQQLGVRGRVLYLRGPSDEAGFRELAEAIRDQSVRQALRESRIGLVGGPSDWLVASSPTPETVRRAWGPTVVHVPLELILSGPGPQEEAGGEALARDFQAGAEGLVEPGEPDLLVAARVHGALRRVVDEGRFDAVAVRCFDLVTRSRTTGCMALAQLNDEGTIAGCEGDLVATVAMLWVHLLLEQAPWMANPSRIDLAGGILSLAHCTAPRSAGGAYLLRSHFESGLGVGIQSRLPTGPVTLVRIGGSRMERLRAVDGRLLGNTDHPDLCRTQVEVELGRETLQDLLAQPLGNHVVVAWGHHAAALRRWHEAMIDRSRDPARDPDRG